MDFGGAALIVLDEPLNRNYFVINNEARALTGGLLGFLDNRKKDYSLLLWLRGRARPW